MPKDEPLIKELLSSIPQIGTVEFISVRPERRVMPVLKNEVNANEAGLEGDHFKSQHSRKRSVTLIQKEHLDAVGNILMKEIDPLMTRRNIVVSGINLLALKSQQFKIGEAVLKGTGECHPCSRMEENLGVGGYNAMRGHGGITAEVITNGQIKVGDQVALVRGTDKVEK